MYSLQNEGKTVVAERFIRSLQTKIYKYNMTLISKNTYIDKLDDIENEYNNPYQRTIKMKQVDVKNNTYIDSIKEVNDEDLLQLFLKQSLSFFQITNQICDKNIAQAIRNMVMVSNNLKSAM